MTRENFEDVTNTMQELKLALTPLQTFICSKSTTETQVLNMFEVNNKNKGTSSMTLL